MQDRNEALANAHVSMEDLEHIFKEIKVRSKIILFRNLLKIRILF